MFQPTTPLEKLIAAHELLADVAQALAGSHQAVALVASRVLANNLAELRQVAEVVKNAGLA